MPTSSLVTLEAPLVAYVAIIVASRGTLEPEAPAASALDLPASIAPLVDTLVGVRAPSILTTSVSTKFSTES